MAELSANCSVKLSLASVEFRPRCCFDPGQKAAHLERQQVRPHAGAVAGDRQCALQRGHNHALLGFFFRETPQDKKILSLGREHERLCSEASSERVLSQLHASKLR